MESGLVTAERNEADDLFQRLFVKQRFSRLRRLALLPRRAAHLAIRGYQLSLSMLVGRHCRHWPSCSAYTDEAMQRFGVWRGGWMGLARICRCNPYGTSGIDIVCEELPPGASWYRPWAYGRWRGTNVPAAIDSGADPAAGGGTTSHSQPV